jgi:hypothetical protein
MSFLTPWLFGAGVLAALGVVALHLLTTRRPPPTPLPTARFVPESDVRAVARASRPTDLLLLALRALAVMAIGAAFARPVFDAPGPAVRAVLAVEWSAGLAAPDEVRAQVQGLLGDGDALVVFDTAARVVEPAAFDTLAVPSVARRVGALSPMFVAARDAAQEIARGADSVRLIVVGTFAREGLDAASEALRSAWPGRVELIRVAGVVDSVRAARVALIGATPDDPLVPAVAAVRSTLRGNHEVRVVRRATEATDSAWLAGTAGEARAERVLVVWPLIGDAEPAPDAVSAVRPDGATLVAPLARLAAGGGRVVARWRDGTPAATEQLLSDAAAAAGSAGVSDSSTAARASCIRTVGIGLPDAGDLTLRPPFGHLLDALLAPCGGVRSESVADSSIAWLTAGGPLATGPALAASNAESSPATRWLLLAAVALLIAEQLLRGRARRSVA